jgi:hypothetical protein
MIMYSDFGRTRYKGSDRDAFKCNFWGFYSEFNDQRILQGNYSTYKRHFNLQAFKREAMYSVEGE